MPRKAPSTVFEHRVTLGDFERREIKEFMEQHEKEVRLNTLIKSGAVVGGVGVLSATAWIGYQIWKEINGIAPPVLNNLKTVSNPTNILNTFLYRSGLMSKEEYVSTLPVSDIIPEGVEPPEGFYDQDRSPQTGTPFIDFILKQIFAY